MVQTIGIDLGSQKCMLVADDADIVLTDTGSIARPTLVSFFGKSRLVGEEAAPQVMSRSYIVIMFVDSYGLHFAAACRPHVTVNDLLNSLRSY
jgi:molecular chaperone DnaK (HSP70)